KAPSFTAHWPPTTRSWPEATVSSSTKSMTCTPRAASAGGPCFSSLRCVSPRRPGPTASPARSPKQPCRSPHPTRNTMQSRFETFVVRTQADTRYVAHLASLNDVGAGIISLLVRPNARRVGWFARDFLAAMGKRRDVSGKGRNDQEDLALVPVWLAVHRITDVILAGAEALTAGHLADLMLILASSRVRLWLVCDQQLGSGVTDLADEWPMTAVD